MRKCFVCFMILALLFAFGCAKEPVAAPEPVAPQPAPALEPIVPQEEEAAAAPSEPEGETAPIGNRVTGEEPEVVEEDVPEDVEEIMLNADKTMSLSEKTISAGTTLAWKNYDSWPHILAVETGKGFDTVRHAESERLTEGMVWEYTFNEKGTFLVRDIFSGSMRMTVSVE